MPVQYRLETKIIVIEMIGEYSTDELRATILNALNDPACSANSFLLIDLGESRSIYDRSSGEIDTMADFVASLGHRFNNRVALVAPDDLPFGLMRMSSAGSEERGIKARVFRNIDEARKWLLL